MTRAQCWPRPYFCVPCPASAAQFLSPPLYEHHFWLMLSDAISCLKITFLPPASGFLA